jgi:hypothetical protein
MPDGSSPIRRHHARHTVALAVEVRLDGSAGSRTQVTRDIGLGGAFIAMEDAPDVGSVLDLVFHFAGDAHPIAAKAVVRHTIDPFLSRVIGSPPGAGVEFTELALEDERALVTLLQRWEERDRAANLDPVEVPDAGFMVGPDLPPPPPGSKSAPGLAAPDPRSLDEWSAEMKALWPPGILPYDLDAPMPEPDMDEEVATAIRERPALAKPEPAPPPAAPPPPARPPIEPFEESATELFDPDDPKLLGALGPPPSRFPPPPAIQREPAPDLLDLDAGKPDEPELAWDEPEPQTMVETLPDAELTPIDDNTDELFRLEPVGPEQRPHVVAALRNEATRLQGASFEDRIGVSVGADRRAIVAAHQEYCARYDRGMFTPVASTEVDRLVEEIKSLADEARDALVRRLGRVATPTVPPTSVPQAGPTEKLFRDGLEQLTQGHHQQAKDLLSQAHQQAPGRKDIEASMHMALGALMKQYGRLEQSMAHFKRAAELDPGAHQAIEELRGFNKRPDREGRRLLSLFRKKKEKGIG